jgi:Protein of unknown function (DUF3822)
MTVPQFTETQFLSARQPHFDLSLVVKSDHFDLSKLSGYELCIEVGKYRVRFCVIDTQKRCLWLEDYTIGSLLNEAKLLQSLQQLTEKHQFLGKNDWKNVVVSFNTPHFTLIPTEFYKKEYTSQYLKLMRGSMLMDSEKPLTDSISSINAHNVFVADKALHEWFLNTYTHYQPTLIHQSSALIDGALRLIKTNEPQLVLYFEDEYVTVVVASSKKLLLCNKFAYKASADMAYFVLFVLVNLKLKSSLIHCTLYGEITPYSEDYQLLKQFIPSLVFGANPKELVFSDEAFEDLLEHRYFSLYSIHSACC